jgi:hypothetical protein
MAVGVIDGLYDSCRDCSMNMHTTLPVSCSATIVLLDGHVSCSSTRHEVSLPCASAHRQLPPFQWPTVDLEGPKGWP